MFEEEFELLEYESPLDGRSDRCLWHRGIPGDICVLVLHGHGSHEDQLVTRKDIAEGWTRFLVDGGFSVISPNLRDNAWMSNAAIADLEFILEQLRPRLSWKRLLVVSGSMGGTGGLIFAMRKSQLIDGVGVLGGATRLTDYLHWLETQERPVLQEIRKALLEAYPTEALQEENSVCLHSETLTMPVYFCHGGADPTIPVEQARSLKKVMNGRPQFHYEEIPGGGHDSPLVRFRQVLTRLVSDVM